MDDIDFLPEAYRRKCQQRHWVMRRIQFSILLACLLVVFIGFDQHNIRTRRLNVLPKLQHQLTTLENTRLQQQNVQTQLAEITFQREQHFLTLLRASRSRILGEALTQLPVGTQLNSLQLITQPSIWVAAPVSSPEKDQQRQNELKRVADLFRAADLQLSMSGSALTMESIKLYESRLQETGLFTSVALKGINQNGNRFDFSFQAVVINPCRERPAASPENEMVLKPTGQGLPVLPTAGPLNQLPASLP